MAREAAAPDTDGNGSWIAGGNVADGGGEFGKDALLVPFVMVIFAVDASTDLLLPSSFRIDDPVPPPSSSSLARLPRHRRALGGSGFAFGFGLISWLLAFRLGVITPGFSFCEATSSTLTDDERAVSRPMPSDS